MRGLSIQGMREAWLRHRSVIVALVFIGFSVVAAASAFVLPGDDLYLSLLRTLEAGGMDPAAASLYLRQIVGGSWLQATLFSISGTLFSLGAITLAWELISRRTWLDFVKSALSDLFVDPTFSFTLSEWRERSLEAILIARHGPDLGEAVFREVKSSALHPTLMKKDFSYDITLSPLKGSSDFYAANFSLRFTVPSLTDTPVVLFTRQADSSILRDTYETLVKDEDVIYRYLLHTAHDCDLENHFRVLSASIEGSRGTPSLDLTPVPAASANGEYRLLLQPQANCRRSFKQMVRGECTLSLGIETVVDAAKSELPIFLGYPVKKFSSRLDARQIGASVVDVFEFFTAPTPYRRDNHIGTSGIAAGHLDDVILPDSGLAYVWRS